ncbi:ubiquinol-cytochrome C chaperone-domain-containing protein [Kalaharituber pfeilii]|nr:ubiquinol-cytochrome C chaperone-domain-containing protein [Kalaharituber pfeilii]
MASRTLTTLPTRLPPLLRPALNSALLHTTASPLYPPPPPPPATPSVPPTTASSGPTDPIPKLPIEPGPGVIPRHVPPAPVGGIIDNIANRIRVAAPETTETYRAYKAGKELYLECARQGAYIKDEEANAEGPAVAADPTAVVTRRKREFLVTILHMWTLIVRFRALNISPSSVAVWQQHFVDHFFYDAEEKMEHEYGVKSSPLRGRYLKDLFVQHRGMVAAYDEALAKGSDAVLAAAVWRNLFDAREDTDLRMVAGVVGYVRRVLRGLEKVDDEMVMGARVAFGEPWRVLEEGGL